jgi:hypothetical protein
VSSHSRERSGIGQALGRRFAHDPAKRRGREGRSRRPEPLRDRRAAGGASRFLTTGYGQVRFTASAATDDPLFRPLDDAALPRLDDDALIAYMRDARTNGHPSAARALAILVYGHWRNVERRVQMKIPSAHVEDLTGDIVADAIASAFEGKSIGEFRSWLTRSPSARSPTSTAAARAE